MKKLLIIIAAACCLAVPSAALAGEVKLALFAFDANSAQDLSSVQKGIATMLPGRLSMPGQISVIELPAAGQAGAKARSLSAADRLAMAKKAGAAYLLAGSITKLGKTISIDARLLETAAGSSPMPISVQSTGLDGIIPQLNILAQKARSAIIGKNSPGLDTGYGSFASEGQQGRRNRVYTNAAVEPDDYSGAPRRPRSKPSRFETDLPSRTYGKGPGSVFAPAPANTFSVKGKPLYYMCTGDVNGDGTKELIAAGPDFVGIYALKNGALIKISEIQIGIDEHVVHVDAGDFNGNGIAEIYVSCYETQSANSFIVEFKDNNYVRLAEKQRWFYRVYPLSDGTVKLIGQEAGTTSPFVGDIFIMKWKEGKLISRIEFILPGSRSIYGFGEGDIDADGVTDFLVFDKPFFSTQPELIMVSTSSKTVWRDRRKMGGSPNSFTTYISELDQTEFVPLRIICADLSPDGRWIAIVGKNYRKGGGTLGKLFDFNEGNVQCLLWDGADLEPVWTSAPLNDTVRDYIFEDFDNDGEKELIILSLRSRGMSGSYLNTFTTYKTK